MKRATIYTLAGLLLSAAAAATIAITPRPYPPELLSGASHPAAPKRPAVAPPATAFASKAPIALSWRLADRPQLGQAVAVKLDFQALTGLSAEVRLRGEEGLEVHSTDFSIGHRAPAEHWSAQVMVTPTLASRRYLNVVVTTVDDTGNRRLRGFAVPVVVDPGAVRAKAGGPARTDAQGLAVISLPAREEARRTP